MHPGDCLLVLLLSRRTSLDLALKQGISIPDLSAADLALFQEPVDI